MEKYYCTETTGINVIKDTYDFIVKASTLTSAKIQARQEQMFLGSCLNLYLDEELTIRVAHSDYNQKWVND